MKLTSENKTKANFITLSSSNVIKLNNMSHFQPFTRPKTYFLVSSLKIFQHFYWTGQAVRYIQQPQASDNLCQILYVNDLKDRKRVNCLFMGLMQPIPALILEEIAIDSHQKDTEDKLLTEAQDLHLQSLALARKAFGENNVQTAKHYGNLGRLYQSMHRYEVYIILDLTVMEYELIFIKWWHIIPQEMRVVHCHLPCGIYHLFTKAGNHPNKKFQFWCTKSVKVLFMHQYLNVVMHRYFDTIIL